jgi:hypothetical protein
MVRRSGRISVAAVVATLAVAPALTGCTQALQAGLGLLGVRSSRATGTDPLGVDRPAARPTRVEAPSATIGDYERAPDYTWDGYATATPASFSRLFTAGPEGESCTVTGMGVARVLPVGQGAPAWPVQRLGPFTLGVAGPGVDALGPLWLKNQVGFPRAAMRYTAQAGTWGTCQRGLFAFVSLGTSDAYEPVVVR